MYGTTGMNHYMCRNCYEMWSEPKPVTNTIVTNAAELHFRHVLFGNMNIQLGQPYRWEVMPSGVVRPLQHTANVPQVMGFRGYNISIDGFLSGGHDQIWTTNTLQYKCMCGLYGYIIPNQDHILDPNAECGIYISKAINSFKGANVNDSPVLATVVAWGKGYEHETGYRMEWCRIEEIFIRVEIHHRYHFMTPVEVTNDGALEVMVHQNEILAALIPENIVSTAQMPTLETIEAIKTRYEVPVTCVNASDWGKFQNEFIWRS